VSLVSLLSIHQITVLRLVVAQGASMDAQRKYQSVGTAMGRVMPNSTMPTQELMRSGYILEADIFFPVDYKLHLSDRLQYNGTIYRIIPPVNPHESGLFWKLTAKAHQADNQTIEEMG
jgi:hypothetical protein